MELASRDRYIPSWSPKHDDYSARNLNQFKYSYGILDADYKFNKKVMVNWAHYCLTTTEFSITFHKCN